MYHMTPTSCRLRTDPLSMSETAYGDVSSPITVNVGGARYGSPTATG